MSGRAGWVALGCALWAFFVLIGCDSARECSHDGRTLIEGESVDDIGRQLRCTCASAGLMCVDLPGAVILGDAGPTDARTDAELDARPLDRGLADATLDAVIDAEPDAEPIDPPDAMPPPPCPDLTFIAGNPCPGRAGQICDEGAPFECCGRPYPSDRRCACEGGVWQCTDHIEACESDPDIGACGQRDRLCQRWRAVRDEVDPTESWQGDHAQCVAAEMDAAWRSTTLDLINVHREIAGVRPVQTTRALDGFAQLCALAIKWHLTFDHQLEEDDRCYSIGAREGVEGSLIANSPALLSIEDYMRDFGEQNFDRMSHRLYLLAPQLGPIGIGSTSEASCVYVFGGDGPRNDPPWVAWPAPGPFPIDAAWTEPAGWTIQSSAINLAFADVRVSVDGVDRPIDQRYLQAAGPAGWGIAWLPVGWQIEAGTTYRVEVTGGVQQGRDVGIDYAVEVIDCDAP